MSWDTRSSHSILAIIPCAMALGAARGEGSPVPPQTKLQRSSARGSPTSTMPSWATANQGLLQHTGDCPSRAWHHPAPQSAKCVPATCSTHHQSHICLQLPVALGIPAAQSRGVSDAQQPELQGQHVHRRCGQGEAGGEGCRGFHPWGASSALAQQLSRAGGRSGACRERLPGWGGVLGSAGATGHEVGIEGDCCGHSQGLGAEQGAGHTPSTRRSRRAGCRCHAAAGGRAVPRLRATLQSWLWGAGGRHRAWAGRAGPCRSCCSGNGAHGCCPGLAVPGSFHHSRLSKLRDGTGGCGAHPRHGGTCRAGSPGLCWGGSRGHWQCWGRRPLTLCPRGDSRSPRCHRGQGRRQPLLTVGTRSCGSGRK